MKNAPVCHNAWCICLHVLQSQETDPEPDPDPMKGYRDAEKTDCFPL